MKQQLGDYTEAINEFQEAVQIARMQGTNGHNDGDCLKFLGECYIATGQYDSALSCLEESIACHEHCTDEDGKFWCNSEARALIGDLYMRLGRYNAALRQFDHYRESIWRCPGFETNVRSVLLNLRISEFYLALGMNDTAHEYLNQARSITAHHEHAENKAGCMLALGRVLAKTDDSHSGLDVLNEALVAYQSMGSMLGIAQAQLEIAKVWIDLGEAERALSYLELAHESLADVGSIPEQISCSKYRGQCELQLGHFEDAATSLNAGLELAQRTGRASDEAEIYMQLGQLHYQTGELEYSENELLQAVETNQVLCQQFTWESGLGGSLVEAIYQAGRLLVAVQLDLGKTKEAFLTAQRIKAAPLVEMITRAQLLDINRMEADELDTYRTNQAQLQYLRQELPFAADQDKPGILDKIDQLTRESEASWRELCDKRPIIASVSEWQPIAPEQIMQAQLATDEVLVDYLAFDDELLAFVLPARGELAVERVPLADHAGDRFASYIDDQVAKLYSTNAAEYTTASVELGEMLLPPVVGFLADAKALRVCPDGVLNTVPFCAVADSDGRYLVEELSIAYIGNPACPYECEPAESATESLVAGISSFSGMDNTELADLPFAEREAVLVADLLAAEPLLNNAATSGKLLAELPGKRVVHLATHGRLSATPLLNGLYASPGGRQNGMAEIAQTGLTPDGCIAMHEIMGLDLAGCELVTLSCCSSAAGDYSPGQGLMGLTQAFLIAGADTVMATQTRVDDCASLVLIEEFYSGWLENGAHPAEALRQAQLSMLQRDEHSAPRYWAPFIVWQ